MIVTKEGLMKLIEERIYKCESCPLHATRTNVVPGEGSLDSPIVMVGEGPGEEEDRTGRPFVGRAGRLLTKMLEDVGLRREDLYITNVVKCRPPNNRVPTPQEMKACGHYLMAQIEVINPKVIVALGGTALSFFLEKKVSITKMRGKEMEWYGGKILFSTFHPSYLLRNKSKEIYELAMSDMKKVKEYFERYRKIKREEVGR